MFNAINEMVYINIKNKEFSDAKIHNIYQPTKEKARKRTFGPFF